MDSTPRLEEIFDRIRRLPRAEREAALSEACGDDEALRLEVESLLRADEAASGWKPPTGQDLQAWTGGSDPWIGADVGGCVVQRKIAHGGMGVVYEAEQQSPRRTVALKFMRSPISTEQERIRFEQEASVLGRLRHEGVAAVHRAGTHREGSNLAMPYIVMEFVAGAEPISDFVAGTGRDAARVIALFLDVCEAVHHAHERGVIHRDLKPSNIIVGREGRPKVIDFGIAKSDAEVDEATPSLTRTGQVLGTIAYASPEQVRGRHEEIGTRSDIYALGLVLYELLTGSRPYELDESDLLGAARQIDGAPVPHHDALATDVLRILRRALAKDPGGRYDSVAAFGDDLRRFLRGEPVTARPPSVTYQLRLFARRHRAIVAVGAASLVALIALTIVSVRSAREARTQAKNAKRESERAVQMLEASQRALGRVASEFFDEVEPLPGSLRARRVIAEALDRGLHELKLEAGDKPELRRLAAVTATHLSRVFGGVHSESTGALDKAIRIQREALQQLLTLAGDEPSPPMNRDLFLAHLQMAQFLHASGAVAASKTHGESAEAAYRRFTAVEEPSIDLRARWVSFLIGRSWRVPPRSEERLTILIEALREAESLRDDDTPQRPMTLGEVNGTLGQVRISRREYEEAKVRLDASRDAFQEAKRRFASDAPLLSRLGLLHMRYGDLARYRRDLSGSVGHYTESARILRQRLEFEKDNAQGAKLLALALSRVARAHVRLSNRHWWLPLAERWVEQEPNTDEKKRAWMHMESAHGYLKEVLTIIGGIIAKNPGIAKQHFALSEAQLDLVDVLGRKCLFPERDRALEQALEGVEDLHRRFPDAAETKRIAAKSLRVRGTGCVVRARYHGIRTEQRLAIAELERGIEWLEKARDAYELVDPSVAKGIARTIAQNKALLAKAR